MPTARTRTRGRAEGTRIAKSTKSKEKNAGKGGRGGVEGGRGGFGGRKFGPRRSILSFQNHDRELECVALDRLLLYYACAGQPCYPETDYICTRVPGPAGLLRGLSKMSLR